MGSKGEIKRRKSEYQDFESFGAEGASPEIHKFNLNF